MEEKKALDAQELKQVTGGQSNDTLFPILQPSVSGQTAGANRVDIEEDRDYFLERR